MVNEICFSDVLWESGTEIFETMAFMSVEKASEPDQKIDGDSLLASITLPGFHCGMEKLPMSQRETDRKNWTGPMLLFTWMCREESGAWL